MSFDYHREPVCKMSARVTKQEDCRDLAVDIDNLKDILIQIDKKRLVIKKRLGIKNRRQLKNKMTMFNKWGRCSAGYKKDRDMFLELVKLGEDRKKIQHEISLKKKEVK